MFPPKRRLKPPKACKLVSDYVAKIMLTVKLHQVIAMRFEKVSDLLISHDQTGLLKGRCIGL